MFLCAKLCGCGLQIQKLAKIRFDRFNHGVITNIWIYFLFSLNLWLYCVCLVCVFVLPNSWIFGFNWVKLMRTRFIVLITLVFLYLVNRYEPSNETWQREHQYLPTLLMVGTSKQKDGMNICTPFNCIKTIAFFKKILFEMPTHQKWRLSFKHATVCIKSQFCVKIQFWFFLQTTKLWPSNFHVCIYLMFQCY